MKPVWGMVVCSNVDKYCIWPVQRLVLNNHDIAGELLAARKKVQHVRHSIEFECGDEMAAVVGPMVCAFDTTENLPIVRMGLRRS